MLKSRFATIPERWLDFPYLMIGGDIAKSLIRELDGKIPSLKGILARVTRFDDRKAPVVVPWQGKRCTDILVWTKGLPAPFCLLFLATLAFHLVILPEQLPGQGFLLPGF